MIYRSPVPPSVCRHVMPQRDVISVRRIVDATGACAWQWPTRIATIPSACRHFLIMVSHSWAPLRVLRIAHSIVPAFPISCTPVTWPSMPAPDYGTQLRHPTTANVQAGLAIARRPTLRSALRLNTQDSSFPNLQSSLPIPHSPPPSPCRNRTSWSIGTGAKTSVVPACQRTSMRSIRSREPNPKCSRLPKWLW